MSKKSCNFAPDFEFYKYVRRFLNLIVVLFFAVTVMAQSEEPVIITAPDTVIEKTAYTLSEQGITIEVSYGSAYPASHSYNHTGYTYFACLANSTITFRAEQPMKGIAINGWVKKNFTASCDKGWMDYLSDEYEDSTGEPVLTVSDIDSTSVTISCDNQLRCFSVEVYFTQNPGEIAGEVMDTVRFTAVKAQAADYSDDESFSSEGSYSYWLNLIPATTYPQVWLDMYSAVKGDLSGTYSLYDYNVGDYTYVQLSADELDYEYAYDQAFTITKTQNGYHIEGYIIADNDIQYEFVYDGPIELQSVVEEGMENAQQAAVKAQKIIRNGQLILLYDGQMMDVRGCRMKE
jgi:hypothetical protein